MRNKKRTKPLRKYLDQTKVKDLLEIEQFQNYLIGSHPHGIISMNTYANFVTNGTGLFEKLPGMTVRVCTLVSQFWIPLRREWAMLHGLIDCSKESLHYVLNSSINNIVVLIVGMLCY